MAIFVVFERRSPKKDDFWLFFCLFSIYLAPSGAKYCEKGLAAIGKSSGKGSKALERVRDGFGKPLILEMQVFGA